MDNKEFLIELEKNEGGFNLFTYYYENLTKKQRELAFNKAIKVGSKCFLLLLCNYPRLTQKQKNRALIVAHTSDLYYLFTHHNDVLNEKQKNIAFKQAIKRGKAHNLIEYHLHKLTKEQIKIARREAIKKFTQDIDNIINRGANNE